MKELALQQIMLRTTPSIHICHRSRQIRCQSFPNGPFSTKIKVKLFPSNHFVQGDVASGQFANQLFGCLWKHAVIVWIAVLQSNQGIGVINNLETAQQQRFRYLACIDSIYT
jgi:hypothetical protein